MTLDKGGLPPNGQLRWRTRRGLRELDVILQHYLEQRYPEASEVERQAFVQLLEQPDADLLDWLLGRAAPPEQFADVVRSLGRGR